MGRRRLRLADRRHGYDATRRLIGNGPSVSIPRPGFPVDMRPSLSPSLPPLLPFLGLRRLVATLCQYRTLHRTPHRTVLDIA
eukprot:2063281-Rhodomonas_salina.3